MALWQYTFRILPEDSFVDLSNISDFVDNDGLFDDEPFWKYVPTNRNIFSKINELLPQGKS